MATLTQTAPNLPQLDRLSLGESKPAPKTFIKVASAGAEVDVPLQPTPTYDPNYKTSPAPKTEASESTATAAAAIPQGQWFSDTGLPDSAYPYAHFLPTYNKGSELKQAPLTLFEHNDPGHAAKKRGGDTRAFLAKAEVDDLSPGFGSEIKNIQLSTLDKKAREELALYVAERGVVAFRDQDFQDQDPEWLIEDWGKFFGRPHVHPTTGQPATWPEFHLVHRQLGYKHNYDHSKYLTQPGWHSDVTYEKQPPGLTALYLFDSPPSGGDTGFADQRSAYARLSPSFAAYLETLSVIHSGVEQAQDAIARGEVIKRAPVETIHPLVRRHPVTGEKAIYVNPVFSRSIVGLKKEESDTILKLLYEHVERGVGFQVRVRWRPRTVVLWDNRITTHTAIADFDATGKRRHGARITPQAERPTL